MIPNDVEMIIMTKKDYDRNVEQLLLEKIELQERIDKAIEYLEEKWKEPEWWDTDFMICINILKGESGTLKEILGDKK